MVYTAFDDTLPNAATQNGTTAMRSVRDNLRAMRDAVVFSAFPGWNFSKSGGTAEMPAIILYSKSTDRLRVSLTWGTTGGATDNVTVAVYEFSSNSGSSYVAIGTSTVTWDAAGLITATTWS